MSTIKSSDEHLTLNADGSSKDIKFQANGVEKASISSSGEFTSTTIDATKLTGDLPAISGANLTGVGVAGISSSADATAMTITSGEKVGFGTTTPQATVTVKVQDTAVSAGVNFLAEAKGSAGSTGGYYFSSHDLASPRKKQAIVNKKNTGGSTGDYGVGSLLFLVDSNTDDADVSEADKKLEITSDGRGLSQFTAKAWVTYKQETGSGYGIQDSHNVSSVTDRAEGKGTINFANAMGNTNYCAVGNAFDGNGENDARMINHSGDSTKSTSAFDFFTGYPDASGDGSALLHNDAMEVTMIVFGD